MGANVAQLHQTIDELPDWETTDLYDVIITQVPAHLYDAEPTKDVVKQITELGGYEVAGIFLDNENQCLRIMVLE